MMVGMPSPTKTNTVQHATEDRRVGATVAAFRTQWGYSQDALATAVGVSRSYIALIEAGRKRLPKHLLFRVAAALDVDPLAIKVPEVDLAKDVA